MWEVARLFPSQPLLEKYIQGALPQTFRDAVYYRELMRTAAVDVPKLPAGIDLTPDASVPPAPTGGLSRRIVDLFRGRAG